LNLIIPILPKHCKAILRYLICCPVKVAFKLMAKGFVLLAASGCQVAERHIPFILITDLELLTG